MDGADYSSFRRGRRRLAGESPGRGGGASANPSNSGVFWGVERARRVGRGVIPPRTLPARPGGDFRTFRRFGFAAPHLGGRARPARRRKKNKTLLCGGARERQISRFWAAKKPNRTAAHNSHSAPSSRGASSPPPASAWSGYLTGRPARPQSAGSGECEQNVSHPRSGAGGAGRGIYPNLVALETGATEAAPVHFVNPARRADISSRRHRANI